MCMYVVWLYSHIETIDNAQTKQSTHDNYDPYWLTLHHYPRRAWAATGIVLWFVCDVSLLTWMP